ncbi:carboxymuconolactone decarboxylase family protein [Burkholderia cenocepacia]|nr:carboxymuconolactone decarboxylase family protein [Burkholderia cenocepacia]MDR5670944.1 carboxymuconolactone decarboxylase family protein [Burkholderia cenocepacia]
MTQRLNYIQQSPELFRKFLELSNLLRNSAIEESIRDLVSVRASQINGCAFCLDMHVKEARIHGERELRLHHLRGGEPVTLKPGQTFYEGPNDLHTVGRNASRTRPAKFIVLLLKDKGAPVLVPEK